MDASDKETAARVWQRVQSRDALGQIGAGLQREDPASLLMQAHALAGMYLGIRRLLPGKAGDRCSGLYRSQKRTVECLRGLCRMDGGSGGLPPMEVGKGGPAEQLRACAHRERRLGEALARLAAEGEFSLVYAQLARQAGERCRMVLEILGKLEQ